MRFSTFLLLFIFIFSIAQLAKSQNLIADWSAEEYETCPTGLALTQFIPTWLSFRGTPDYFHSCSTTLGPTNNDIGYQVPKTGDGIIGAVVFHPSLSNGREYVGVELIQPLEIGESYQVSFNVAAAYSGNPWLAGRVTDNLGFLLMTEVYLDSNELGTVPNFAHHKVETLIGDTAEWTQIFGTIVADSAYKYVAFGNFFDDTSTNDSLLPEREITAVAYYFYDDFCIVSLGEDCTQVLSANHHSKEPLLQIYPNPADSYFILKFPTRVKNLYATNQLGLRFGLLYSEDQQSNEVRLDARLLPSGIYILHVETEEGVARNKVVIQH